LLWINLLQGSANLAAANVSVMSHSLSAGALALAPFTVVRTRGVWHVRTDATGAAEFYSVSLGFAQVSVQASTIGVSAIPTPVTDGGSGNFFVYETISGFHELVTDVGKLEGGRMLTFDSKAMRKIQEEDDVVIVQETSGLSSGAISVIQWSHVD